MTTGATRTIASMANAEGTPEPVRPFAGDAGTVFHWDGTTCTLVPHPLASTPYTVIEGTAPNDVWFFGASATLQGSRRPADTALALST